MLNLKGYGSENNRGFSCSFKKLNRYILICKWHSLTIHIANFVKDSILKNYGISIFILVDV